MSQLCLAGGNLAAGPGGTELCSGKSSRGARKRSALCVGARPSAADLVAGYFGTEACRSPATYFNKLLLWRWRW